MQMFDRKFVISVLARNLAENVLTGTFLNQRQVRAQQVSRERLCFADSAKLEKQRRPQDQSIGPFVVSEPSRFKGAESVDEASRVVQVCCGL
jgi:hypothetical protein